MPCHQEHPRNLYELREITRRHFFQQCGVGVGKIALASLNGCCALFEYDVASDAVEVPASRQAISRATARRLRTSQSLPAHQAKPPRRSRWLPIKETLRLRRTLLSPAPGALESHDQGAGWRIDT